jgi:dihydroorotate dehydrogenase
MSAADLGARLLLKLDAETAHRLALTALGLGLGPRARPSPPALRTRLAGLDLPNPLGLAAGFDKDAAAPDALLRAGFGFVECGTVTPRPQAGNPRPRLFRLPDDRAVINRLGFNNLGLEAFARRLERRPRQGVVGANLGANKDSEDRIADYVAGLRRLLGLCDYFTVNVSSPNTPGLRDLQEAQALDGLLGALADARDGSTPLFLKVAPDLDEGRIGEIVAAVRRHGVDGVVVSNTTVSRPEGLRSPRRGEAGGLSGAPLLDLSTRVLRAFRAADAGLPLVGVGGVFSAADVRSKLAAGADAVQLYTALALEGPGLVAKILADLAEDPPTPSGAVT